MFRLAQCSLRSGSCETREIIKLFCNKLVHQSHLRTIVFCLDRPTLFFLLLFSLSGFFFRMFLLVGRIFLRCFSVTRFEQKNYPNNLLYGLVGKNVLFLCEHEKSEEKPISMVMCRIRCCMVWYFATFCTVMLITIFFRFLFFLHFTSLEVLVNAIALHENFHSFTRWSMVSSRAFDKHVNDKKRSFAVLFGFSGFSSVDFMSARPKTKTLFLSWLHAGGFVGLRFPVARKCDWVVLSITLRCIESFWRSHLNSDSLKPVRRYLQQPFDSASFNSVSCVCFVW